MALAESKIITEEQIIEVEVDREVVLTLSKDEAYALAVVLSRVGGPGGCDGDSNSARSLADQIIGALGTVGVDYTKARDLPGFKVLDNATLYFEGATEAAFQRAREML